jgi:hypothetical protein
MPTPYPIDDRRLACKRGHPLTGLCDECGDRFEIRRPWQRFCRPPCRELSRRRRSAQGMPALVVADVRARLEDVEARLTRVETAVREKPY